MRHIPNILSFLRILLNGVFVYFFVNHSYIAALCIYAFSFFTDILDGFLARKFNWISRLGKLLDPFADKLTLITVLGCLYAYNFISWYILIVAIAKELLMIFGSMFMLRKKSIIVHADWWGKIATGIFFLTIIMALTQCAELLPFIPGWFIDTLFIVSICMSVVSMVHYAYRGGMIGKKYRNRTVYEEAQPRK